MVEQQIRNSALNSSFLALNLGTNTLGVGNSFTIPAPSESSHTIPIDKSPATNVVEDDDTILAQQRKGLRKGLHQNPTKVKVFQKKRRILIGCLIRSQGGPIIFYLVELPNQKMGHHLV